MPSFFGGSSAMVWLTVARSREASGLFCARRGGRVSAAVPTMNPATLVTPAVRRLQLFHAQRRAIGSERDRVPAAKKDSTP
jgi:hypothetical protein